MFKKISFIIVLNIISIGFSKYILSDFHEFLSWSAGITIFMMSFLSKIFFVRNLLKKTQKTNTLASLMGLFGNVAVLGLALWYCLVIQKLLPLYLLGGMVFGLVVFSTVFYSVSDTKGLVSLAKNGVKVR